MSTKKNTFRHVSDSLKTSIMQNRGGRQVIERILTAYGFTSRQELCNHLGVSQSTMANRYARDTFPADWLLICSIETGVQADWLASGDASVMLSGESSSETKTETHALLTRNAENQIAPVTKSPIENSLVFDQGGKAAIERLIDAYGFATRQALADHLKVSKSTLANRYLRDTFPSDWVIKCSLETGVSLLWLASGEGSKYLNHAGPVVNLLTHKLIDGVLQCGNLVIFDRQLIPDNINSPMGISVDDKTYIADTAFSEVTDGVWLIEIEGTTAIRNLIRIPVGKVKITNNTSSFECKLDDIKLIAKCHSVVLNNI